MKAIIFVAILFLTSVAKAQVALTPEPPKFANQGQQEDYWAKINFEKYYKPQTYKRFKGNIDVSKKGSVLYNNISVEVNVSLALMPIFERGLIYPEVIFRSRHFFDDDTLQNLNKPVEIVVDTTNILKQEETLTLATAEFSARIMAISIDNLEEVKFLSTSPVSSDLGFGCGID